MKVVVVTRDRALVEYLHEIGLVPKGVRVIPHATEDDVRGRHVIGMLPIHLAMKAAVVTEIPLALGPEDWGKELTLERLRQVAQPSQSYILRDITKAK